MKAPIPSSRQIQLAELGPVSRGVRGFMGRAALRCALLALLALGLLGRVSQAQSQDPLVIDKDGKVTVNGSLTAGSFAGPGTIPIGGIILWSGSINAIPSGWALCNGQSVNDKRTPDLSERFVVGAGSTYAVDKKGGGDKVTLTVEQMPEHAHAFHDAYKLNFWHVDTRGVVAHGGLDRYTASEGIPPPEEPAGSYGTYATYATKLATGSTNLTMWWRPNTTDPVGSNAPITIPPPSYYALAYIMRVQ